MYGAATDKGLIRTNNEDSYAVLPPEADRPGVLVVADGMGGHRKGELASRIAVDYLVDRLRDILRNDLHPDDVESLLTDLIQKANVRVYVGSLEDPENHGMGTTLTTAVLTGETLVIGHVGDSRAYRLRGHSLQRMTTDHTLVQEMVDSGSLTPEQASTHPKRHIITRALGVPEFMPVQIVRSSLQRGDRVLLCSDGLHGSVSEEVIRQLLRRERTAALACRRLLEAALAAGGEDNITVVAAYT